MEHILRKHILSEYASTHKTEITSKTTLNTAFIETSDSDRYILSLVDPTTLTETVEHSDPDEFKLSDLTQITKSVGSPGSNCFVMADPTYLTHAVETSDPDEFRLCDPTTYETNIVEISDPDEFKMSGATMETRNIETTDPDEMRMGPTKKTFNVETSDEDEFLLM